MPNWCTNIVRMSDLKSSILDDLIKKLEGDTDSPNDSKDGLFSYFRPMPSNIYRGSLGEKERKLYGENNWHDWSRLQLGN